MGFACDTSSFIENLNSKKSLENLFDKQHQTFQNYQKYSSLFASNVFTNEVLEQYVNKDAFNPNGLRE